MTTSNMEDIQRLRLQRQAYLRVVDAWKWVADRPLGANYRDTYLDTLSPDSCTGVMPIAETLMCLLNTREAKYRQLGIPQAPNELLEAVANDLSNAFSQHGFSGAPYVESRDDDMNVDFVDAACYVVGALVRFLPFQVENENSAPLLELLDHSVGFLLEAAVEIPNTDGDGLDPMWGWSWGNPGAQKGGPFANSCPPQTYFTAQAFITLLEVVFDSHGLAKKHTDNILERLVGAKRLLLTTMISANDENDFGWSDFTPEIAQQTGQDGMAAYSRNLEPVRELTLYGLEALSYVNYYAMESQYQSARADLRRRPDGLFDNLVKFTNIEELQLAKAFSLASSLITSDSLFEDSCQIQIPEPLNLKKGKRGYFESEGESNEKSYYIDGTVPFNLLNACNFYLRYSEEWSENKESIVNWRTQELALVQSILEKGFRGNAFTHPSRFEGKRSEVIYASRTAIASLLSWGVSPSQEPSEGVSEEVRALVVQLANTLDISIGTQTELANTTLDGLDLEPLSRFFFLAGIYASELSRVNGDSADFQEFYDIRGDIDFDRQEAVRVNGRGLVDRLLSAVTGSQETSEREIAALLANANFLSRPYIKTLELERDSLVSKSPQERIEAVGRLQTKLLEDVPRRIKHKLEELYGS